MKSITILGIACVDIIVTGYRQMPELGQLEFIDNMKLYTGGCALNCSIDLAKIGVEHNLIIPIGYDVFGDYILKSLQKSKLKTDHILRLNNASTSSSVVFLDKSGERSFLHNPGANALLDIRDININQVLESEILFVGGALLMPNFDGKQMAELFRLAKKSRVYTVLDIGWDPSGKWMETLAAVLPNVDLFIPSLDEAIKLTNKTDLKDIFAVFSEQGVKQTIIKLGKNGAAYINNNHLEIVEAVHISSVIDTTGAGDSFVSGVLTGIANGWEMKKTIQFANVVGSLCVSNFGASEGIKDFNEILKLRGEYYGR